MKIVQGSANDTVQVNNNNNNNEDKTNEEIISQEDSQVSKLTGLMTGGSDLEISNSGDQSQSLTLNDLDHGIEGRQSSSSGTSVQGQRITVDELAKLNKAETHWGCFGVGEKVFAFWKGKTAFSTGYYSGTIIRKGVLNVYNIHFDDDTVSNTSEVQILPIRVLGVGVKVFYLPDEDGSGPVSALVVGQKFDGDKDEVVGDDVEYAVEIYGSPPQTILCERRQLYLGDKQAKELRKKYEAVQPKLGDLNLDNIVTGPRRRGRASESEGKAQSENDEKFQPVARSATSSQQNNNRRVKSLKSSSDRSPARVSNSSSNRKRIRAKSATPTTDFDKSDDSSTEPPPVKTKASEKALTVTPPPVKVQSPQRPNGPTQQSIVQKDQASVQKSSAVQQQQTTEVKKVQSESQHHPPVKMKPKSKSKVGGLPDIVQSANSQKSGLFRGYYFYLTSGDREFMKGLGLGNYAKEISKLEMQAILKKQAGTELLRVGDEAGKDPGKVFLLASSHLRTLKYLYCVARGIPCVAQQWIQDSVEAGKVLDWEKYRLSPGWSIEENGLAPVHNNYPLEGLRIGLVTFKDDTINTWRVLLPACKAEILISKDFQQDRHPPELKVPSEWLEGDKIHILVSDFYSPPEVTAMLKSKEIPLVRIEWLVQTIIMGKKANPRVGDTQQFSNPSPRPLQQQPQA